MSLPFPAKNEETGNRKRIACLTEAGNYECAGTMDITGNTYCRSDLTVYGNLILSDATIVDVMTNIVYNFADPIIELNTSFSAAFVAEIGRASCRERV